MNRVSFLLGATLALGVGLGSAAPSRAAQAGHWRTTTYVRCTYAVGNYSVCTDLFGPIRAVGLRWTVLVRRSVRDYTVDRRGHYRVRATEIFFEKSPHGKALRRCDAQSITVQLFTGTCRYTRRERGRIVRGKRGMPVFRPVEATVTYRGRHPSRQHLGSSAAQRFGPPTPAAPGVYRTARLLALMGHTKVPPGVTIRVAVKRSR